MNQQHAEAVLDLAHFRPRQGLNLVDQVVEVEFGEAPLGEQLRLPSQPSMIIMFVGRCAYIHVGSRGALEYIRAEAATRNAGDALEIRRALYRHLGPLIDRLARHAELARQLGHAADLAGGFANDREHDGVIGKQWLTICQVIQSLPYHNLTPEMAR